MSKGIINLCIHIPTYIHMVYNIFYIINVYRPPRNVTIFCVCIGILTKLYSNIILTPPLFTQHHSLSITTSLINQYYVKFTFATIYSYAFNQIYYIFSIQPYASNIVYEYVEVDAYIYLGFCKYKTKCTIYLSKCILLYSPINIVMNISFITYNIQQLKTIPL